MSLDVNIVFSQIGEKWIDLRKTKTKMVLSTSDY